MSPDVTRTPVLVVTGPDRQVVKRAAFTYQAQVQNPSTDADASELLPQGEVVLQVRHTPRLVGVHAWSLQDPAGTVLANGEVTAAAASAPVGPVRIARTNPRLLGFSDGSVFIPIGPNISWANGPDRLAGFRRYFDKLAAAGGNHCRVWMSSWCGQVEGYTPDSWRLDHAWLVDGILRAARERSLRVTLVLDNHHDLVHGKAFPYGASTDERQKTFLSDPPPASYERRLRYVLARWGADDTILAWELFNELDMAQPIRERCLPWAAAAASLFKRLDGDQRLHTISWCGDDWHKLMSLPGIDLTQMHGYVLEWADPEGFKKVGTRDGVAMMKDEAENALSVGKPFCFSEIGYQGSNERNEGNDLDQDGLLLRQQAWAAFMLGGYGSGMNWWWDTYIDRRGLWGQYRGLSRTIARLDWRDPDFAPLPPNLGEKVLVIGWHSRTQGLIWPLPRSDTWYAHLIDEQPRRPLQGPVQVNVEGFAPGEFALHYLDMITGDERFMLTATAGADGTLPILVPAHALDLVVWVEHPSH
ncbi:MAG: cellulase family glycosylhydrolase [Planctomycetes bacterium]|nr:cellulase family glycosylhydrolase [Planctomycetota bacterium]